MRSARLLTALLATACATSSCLDFGDLSGSADASSSSCIGATCSDAATESGSPPDDGDAGPTVFDGGKASLTLTCPPLLHMNAMTASSASLQIAREGFSGGVRVSGSATGLQSTVISEVTSGADTVAVPITSPPVGGFAVTFTATATDGSLPSECKMTLVAAGVWVSDQTVGSHAITVPPGVVSLQGFVWGAGGGGAAGQNDPMLGKYYSGGNGGGGAVAELVFAATPGDNLVYRVGGGGAVSGTGGGGAGSGGAGGGGFSDINSGSTEILLAGGGGGAAVSASKTKGNSGGAGGAVTGSPGGGGNSGTGGGQLFGGAGGMRGSDNQGDVTAGFDGLAFQGGAGGTATSAGASIGALGGLPGGGNGAVGASSTCGGGGGGGGWYGGGGGSGATSDNSGSALAGAGAGGSSQPITATLAGGIGANPGTLADGAPYLLPNVGNGGLGATSTTSAQTAGKNGLVVILIR